MIKSNTTQENRVLQALQSAKGQWVNGQYFLRELYLSQYHRAIWNLQHRRDKYLYEGDIEASDFTDDHGFKSYRLRGIIVPCEAQKAENRDPRQLSLV